MELSELYQLARVMPWSDFQQEVDYRMTGQLKTAASNNKFVLKQLNKE